MESEGKEEQPPSTSGGATNFPANGAPSGVAGGVGNNSEEIVNKYKRLLAMARSSLEANQVDLKEKDRYIDQLKVALEDEKNRGGSGGGHNGKRSTGKDDDTQIPRNLLRRVDVDNRIWILVEYEASGDGRNMDDRWISFNNDEDVDDFVQRIPGVPLQKPHRSLTPIESSQVESECKKKVDRIVEEFRRFKVKFEIARKQKDVENKHNNLNRGVVTTPMTPSMDRDRSISDTNGHCDGVQSTSEEISRLQNLLNEQDTKWKTAYEKVVKENELLRNRGNETLLATQWRERYETTMKERDELNEKLKVYIKNGEGKSIEQAYLDLKEEYREFRKRFLAIQEQRDSELEELRQRGIILRGGSSILGASTSSENVVPSTDGNASGGNLQNSKMQYIKQMVFQYLVCKDPEVKLHVESALMAMFRFSEAEKNAIEDTRKAENDADSLGLTTISTFLGLSSP